MRERLSLRLDGLKHSFWFVPALLTGAGALLSVAMLLVDQRANPEFDQRWWLFGGGPDAASDVLTTIATSAATVAGVAFSITIVALTLAASQYGPRLLRVFMGDLGSQVVLGTLLGTFIYSLLVLRTVRYGPDEFVPHLSVIVAVLLAMASVTAFVYFIHHIAVMMHSNSVIYAVGRDLEHASRHIFPGTAGRAPERERGEEPRLPERFDEEAVAIRSDGERYGYVQSIEARALLQAASEGDYVLRLAVRPGHYAIQGQVLAHAWPAERARGEDVRARVRRAFILSGHRTPEQDVEFAIERLVEIAVRALSPSVNDPFTAIQCIDRLTAGLRSLAGHPPTSPYRLDEHGALRLVAYPQRLADLIDAGFNQIRQAATAYASVSIALLERLSSLLEHIDEPEAREAILRQAAIIRRSAHSNLGAEEDVAAIEARYRDLIRSVARRHTAASDGARPEPAAGDTGGTPQPSATSAADRGGSQP